jgi:hypothetical protein
MYVSASLITSRWRPGDQMLKDIMKRGKRWQKIEKERLWEERRHWRLFVHQPT